MNQENVFKNTERKRDEFLPIMTSVFASARFFGIPTYGGKGALVWTLVMLTMLICIEVGAIWKLVRLLGGYALNTSGGRNMTARLSGSIFYGNALLSLILSWRSAKKWQNLSKHWLQTETNGLYIPPDVTVRKRVIYVTSFVAVCAVVEHTLSMMSATGFDCPPKEYFERYILSSHGFLLQTYEYSLWLAIPIFLLSKLATILWNFQDLIIILMSMGLASRYHRLNTIVKRVVTYEKRARNNTKMKNRISYVNIWRQIREAYVQQSMLVRTVDEELGALVLLSNLNNLYFICLQLFLGIRFYVEIEQTCTNTIKNVDLGYYLIGDRINKIEGSLINRVYYFYSLGWLVFRACSVVLAAADVNLHSKRALLYLSFCPAATYNVEIKRLKNQLSHDEVVLSGMGFFCLDRQKLLQVAAVIIKYELILIQYDK